MEYIIAGIRIAVPQEFTAGSFGTALAPFAAADEGPADLSVETRGEIRQADGYRELDEFDFADADADCRFGRDSEGYLLTMTPRDGCAAARFRKAFGAPLVTTDVTLRHNPALFRFGLWSMFNIAAVARQAVAIHSSVISLNGGAVLFLGESGTGKSTHTRLWREHIPGAELLNDDSPIVRIVQTADADPICGAVQNPADAPAAAAETPDASAATTGAPKPQAMVFGAPWSGKTPCYRNVCQPIRAIVRLSQAPHNRIRRLRAIEAIGALLPSCPPSFAHDETLEDAVCATVSAVVAQVPDDFRRRIRKSPPVMQLSNRLFFEQVEAMLAEGHEVQIRMKGHSMRPLLRSERDIAVLTPIARYTGNSETAAAARKQNRLARNETAPDTAANSHPDRLPSGSQALQPGDVVLFRCEGRHILHRILRIEPESGEMPPQSANTTVETITKTPEASAIPTAATTEAAATAATPSATEASAIPTAATTEAATTATPSATIVTAATPSTTAAATTASDAGDTPAPLPALRKTGKATPPLPACPENSENPQTASNPGQTPAETAPAPPRLRFTLAGDGNHRMTEHCAATDIAAVMTAVIRPSGRIVSTASRRWRRQSRCWLTLPAAVRRFILRALWRLGIR